MSSETAYLEKVIVRPPVGTSMTRSAFTTSARLDPKAPHSYVRPTHLRYWRNVPGTLVYAVQLEINGPNSWDQSIRIPDFRVHSFTELPDDIGLVLGRNFLEGRNFKAGITQFSFDPLHTL